MRLELRPKALEHLQEWAQADAKKLRRVFKLFEAILRDPFRGEGKPEPLKGDLSGAWSRRIDKEHRVVYRIEDEVLIILQCRYHY